MAPTPAAVPSAPAQNSAGGFSLARQLGLGVSRIVIDPGHGGHDPGVSVASHTTESEVVLDVALRLEKLLPHEPGFEVVMTRRTDVFIPLEERPASPIAQARSVPVDSRQLEPQQQASGVETYFLNFANNPEAEEVAARENATAAQSMHQLPDMVRAIAMNNKLDESRDFAQRVQSSARVGRSASQNDQMSDRGVKQAPFVVLIGAGMPSVLAEIAFLSHQRENGLLRTEGYRQQVAEALFEAVVTYQRSLKASARSLRR